MGHDTLSEYMYEVRKLVGNNLHLVGNKKDDLSLWVQDLGNALARKTGIIPFVQILKVSDKAGVVAFTFWRGNPDLIHAAISPVGLPKQNADEALHRDFQLVDDSEIVVAKDISKKKSKEKKTS